ncbi:PilZ domain-containing protein [Thermodesulfobacteriota bacterium]
MAEKVFVNTENIATFQCPQCKKSWKKDVSQLSQFAFNRLKCKCPCGHSFPAILEKRKHYRKPTNLTGSFIHDRTKRRGIIHIKNVSKSGVGFELTSDQFMHVGDRLGLKFNLDDPPKSFLYKEVVVKKIAGRYVGVEFCEFRHRDALEIYLD